MLVPYRTLASKIGKLSFWSASHAWTTLVAGIDQFKHGAFALTQLFGHRKQFWLL